MGKPFDPLESRRRDEMLQERTNQAQRIEAYKQGVMETSRDPVIFVDPDRIYEIDLRFSQRPPYHRNPGYHLQQQLDRQAPGATNGVLNRINSSADKPVSLNEIAREIRASGPAALSRVTVNGVQYGVVVLPENGLDTKDELVRDSFRHLDRQTRNAIVSHMPGTDLQWMRFIGNHEGEHLNDPVDQKTPLEKMVEEVRADRSAYDLAVARGDGDVALAFRDYRALRAFYDPQHASSPLLVSHDPVNEMHYDAADNSLTRMNTAVALNFDWATYSGKARTPEALLKENPEAYFGAMQKGIDAFQQQVMTNYNADPTSLDAQKAVIQAQIQIDYAKDFEDGYRRRVMGQNVPARQPTQLITQAQEDAYFVEAKYQERLTAETPQVEAETMSVYPEARIIEGVDWSKEGEGYATGDDLFNANPIRFYEIKQERLDVLRSEAVAAHTANPSYENLERLVQLEDVINKNERDLAFERHSADPAKAGTAFEEPAYIDVTTEEQYRDYFEQRMARKDAGTWTAPAAYVPPAPAAAAEAAPPEADAEEEVIIKGEGLETEEEAEPGPKAEGDAAAPAAPAQPSGAPPELSAKENEASPVWDRITADTAKTYRQGVDGTAYTTLVAGLQAGEPTVDFESENRITVGGLSMGSLFAQTADPDPTAVSLVNAREAAPEEDAGYTAPQVRTERTASFGATA